MSKKTEHLHIRVRPDWLERFDDWIAEQPPMDLTGRRLTRTDAVKIAVERLIASASNQERENHADEK